MASAKKNPTKLVQADKMQLTGLIMAVAYNTMMTSGESIPTENHDKYLESLMQGLDGMYYIIIYIILIKQSSQH